MNTFTEISHITPFNKNIFSELGFNENESNTHMSKCLLNHFLVENQYILNYKKFNIFWRVSDEYGILHNMASTPVMHNDIMWNSSEALYQAMKFNPSVESDNLIIHKIFSQKSPYMSKKCISNADSLCMRKDFHDIKISIMLEILYLKYLQNKPLLDSVLFKTNYPFIEASVKDIVWGASPVTINGVKYLKGCNVLGKLWGYIKVGNVPKTTYLSNFNFKLN